MSNDSNLEDLLQLIEDRIRQELRLRCEAYTPDFQMPEVFNVLTALLARQATLAVEFASAPQLWNQHSAPLFLRAMADVHITLSWVLLDTKTRARQYIDHGLGQAVLELEHRKKLMESADDDSKKDLEQIIQNQKAWIDAQRWNFLVEVIPLDSQKYGLLRGIRQSYMVAIFCSDVSAHEEYSLQFASWLGG